MIKKKQHGGARTGTGPKLKDPDDKIVQVPFFIKKKHIEEAKKVIQPIVDQINSKP